MVITLQPVRRRSPPVDHPVGRPANWRRRSCGICHHPANAVDVVYRQLLPARQRVVSRDRMVLWRPLSRHDQTVRTRSVPDCSRAVLCNHHRLGISAIPNGLPVGVPDVERVRNSRVFVIKSTTTDPIDLVLEGNTLTLRGEPIDLNGVFFVLMANGEVRFYPEGLPDGFIPAAFTPAAGDAAPPQ